MSRSTYGNIYDNHSALDAKLRTPSGKPVDSRKMANNTYAIRSAYGSGETIAIRLHNTNVVTFHSDGTIVLNSGGWQTVTTKQRMNEFTPQAIQVHSVRGRWMVAYRSTMHDWGMGPDYANSVPFADGMTFTTDGGIQSVDYDVSGALEPEQVYAQNAHNTSVEKLIDKALKALGTTAGHERILKTPTTCGMCQILDTDHEPYATTAGEVMGDTQHLIDHLVNDEITSGMLHYACLLRNSSGMRRYHRELARLDLRRYLRAQLLVGVATRGGVARTLTHV